MESLNQHLEQMEQQLKTEILPLEAFAILQQSIEEHQRMGIASGLEVGDQAPDFTLKGTLDDEIQLSHELAKGPVILSFYRGGWCPFCNRQLQAYQEILPRFTDLGAQLIAVSPQIPDNTLSETEKEQLTFHVASDIEGRVASLYNVLYEVTDSLKSLYQSMGRNIGEYNGMDRWVLPITATFIIDSTGRIRFSHTDPNFMRRLEPELIVQTLREM